MTPGSMPVREERFSVGRADISLRNDFSAHALTPPFGTTNPSWRTSAGENSSPFHLLRRSLLQQPLGHLRQGLRPVCMWSQSTENTGLLLWLSFPGLTSMLLWQLLFWVSLSQEPLSSWNWICLPSCIWWMLLSIAYIGLIFFSLDSDHHVWCFLSISEWPNAWDLPPPVSQVVSVCRPSQRSKEACYPHGPLMQYSRASEGTKQGGILSWLCDASLWWAY